MGGVRPPRAAPRPEPAALTYLLIHGGASTGAFWDRLLPLLDRPAVAVDLPGRRGRPADLMTVTLDDMADSVVADAPDGTVTIVAHSSGGLVVPRVVDALGHRVDRIVLTSASVPPEGGTGLDCMKPSHRERMEAGLAWAKESGERLVAPVPAEPEALRVSYGERLDDETLAFVWERLVEDTFNVYLSPVRWSTVSQPVTYLRAGKDRAVPPELQDQMLAHLPGEPTVVRWDCGHIPPVTRPQEFAALVAASG